LTVATSSEEMESSFFFLLTAYHFLQNVADFVQKKEVVVTAKCTVSQKMHQL